MLNIAVVSGSSQLDSQSSKVAEFIRSRLALDFKSRIESSSIVDLGRSPLPLWPEKNENLSGHVANLRKADGIVLIVPEWNGMAAPAVKNLFIHAGADEFAHKPALLVGVSAGAAGNGPLNEVRGSSFKNSRINYIPEQLIVRDVCNVLNESVAASENDEYYRQRMQYALDILVKYAAALKPIRETIDMSIPEFASGM